VRVGERGQITIPKPIRDQFGITRESHVDVVVYDNRICVIKRSEGGERIARMRGAITLRFGKDVDEYIEDIRGR
jgi:AbrB family looped-hinge helix DNA binding protein